jgi:3'-phosphoadenosine 5'-phosphosulfate sulfotransferase (PAPS reductase)/FAD synthetase
MTDIFGDSNNNIQFNLRVLSLGAGVQSSVMLLMADRGLLGEKPDVAIFADTQWEPKEIYEHLEWLKTQVSIPIRILSGMVFFLPKK